MLHPDTFKDGPVMSSEELKVLLSEQAFNSVSKAIDKRDDCGNSLSDYLYSLPRYFKCDSPDHDFNVLVECQYQYGKDSKPFLILIGLTIADSQ